MAGAASAGAVGDPVVGQERRGAAAVRLGRGPAVAADRSRAADRRSAGTAVERARAAASCAASAWPTTWPTTCARASRRCRVRPTTCRRWCSTSRRARRPSIAWPALHPLLVRLRRLITRAARCMRSTGCLPPSSIASIPPIPRAREWRSAALANLKDLNDRLDAGVAGARGREGRARGGACGAGAARARWSTRSWTALFDAHAYGMPEALPADGETLSQARLDDARGPGAGGADADRQAAGRGRRAARAVRRPAAHRPSRSDARDGAAHPVALERATDAARELFGTAFVIVPLVPIPSAGTGGGAATGCGRSADRRRVRAGGMAALRRACAAGDCATSRGRWPRRLDRARRSPIRWSSSCRGRPGTPWIGGEFSAPLPEGEWLAVVRWATLAGFSGLQCGLVLDEWTENVPAEKATTGVAFHFNRPNATAPQALLLAVPPVLRGHWQWDALKGCVREALDLAKLRALDPEALATGGYFQGLPAILSEFSKNRLRGDAPDRAIRHGRQQSCRRERGSMPASDRLERIYALAVEPRKPLPLFRGWNRLEGRPRVADFERSLRAEVRDPLWFLTRQWQFGEFQGEDAASPIDVAARRCGPRRWRRCASARIEAAYDPACRSKRGWSASRRRST